MARDHNEKTQQEIYEDQQFMRGFSDLQGLRSDMAETKADMGAIYKRLKDLNWSKADVEFALSLQDKDVGQVIADFERKIRIAKLFGHRLGRQMSLLDEDRTPQDERAYAEGKAAGMLRRQVNNPYHPGSAEARSWDRGNRDGNAFINKDLAEAIGASSEDVGDENDDDAGDETGEPEDASEDGDGEAASTEADNVTPIGRRRRRKDVSADDETSTAKH